MIHQIFSFESVCLYHDLTLTSINLRQISFMLVPLTKWADRVFNVFVALPLISQKNSTVSNFANSILRMKRVSINYGISVMKIWNVFVLSNCITVHRFQGLSLKRIVRGKSTSGFSRLRAVWVGKTPIMIIELSFLNSIACRLEIGKEFLPWIWKELTTVNWSELDLLAFDIILSHLLRGAKTRHNYISKFRPLIQ